ncbi:MAG: hypothetical protein ABGZ53_36100 [Fuerstiella sp.]
MTFSSQQIEAITRDVLRELQSQGVAIAAAPTSSGDNSAGSVAPIAIMQQKVITEDTLAAADVAGQCLSIPAGAIITPSGHDYIRRHAVSISSGVPSKRGTNGVLISVGSCSAASSAAAAAAWTVDSADCEVAAAAAANSVATKHSVVCCGRQPSIMACLVNRATDIRAAVADQNTDIDLLISTMNPQVICLNSTGWTFSKLRRLFRQMSATDNVAPAGWSEITGGVR